MPSRAQLEARYAIVAEADQRAIVEASLNKAMLATEAKSSRAAALMTTWRTPPSNTYNYERVAREGYGSNEIIYTCIELLATSAAEPVIAAYNGKTRLLDHPIIDLLKQPNPWTTGYAFIASMIMFRFIAGNSYVEKVRSRAGNVIELWTPRPDRMIINRLPNSGRQYIYRLGPGQVEFPQEDIGHWKTRNPLDDLYGYAPMAVLLSRTDTDNFAKEFTKSFFFNAGVPQTLIAFKTSIEEEEREMIKSGFRRNYTGPAGWHNVMVAENTEVDVKQLGMPMGARGIAYPEMDEINESRLAMVFGVPLSLVGARLGQKSSSYANRLSDRQQFWLETLMPLYRDLQDEFNKWLIPEFSGVTHIEFDMSTVKSLQEEVDIIHQRNRNNLIAGLTTFQEARRAIGFDQNPPDDDILLVPQNMAVMKVSDFLAAQPPPVRVPVQQVGEPDADGNGPEGAKPPVTMAGGRNGAGRMAPK